MILGRDNIRQILVKLNNLDIVLELPLLLHKPLSVQGYSPLDVGLLYWSLANLLHLLLPCNVRELSLNRGQPQASNLEVVVVNRLLLFNRGG